MAAAAIQSCQIVLRQNLFTGGSSRTQTNKLNSKFPSATQLSAHHRDWSIELRFYISLDRSKQVISEMFFPTHLLANTEKNKNKTKLAPCGTDGRLLLSGFQLLVTLTLTLDRVIRHTVLHQSSTSICIPNFIEIGKTFFCERTNRRTAPSSRSRDTKTTTNRKSGLIKFRYCAVV